MSGLQQSVLPDLQTRCVQTEFLALAFLPVFPSFINDTRHKTIVHLWFVSFPWSHVHSVIKSYWPNCLTYFCSISQTYTLSSVLTSFFPSSWTVRISSQQDLLSPFLASQPNIVAKVIFLKLEGDDITLLLRYSFVLEPWFLSCRANFLASSARPAILAFPRVYHYPL